MDIIDPFVINVNYVLFHMSPEVHQRYILSVFLYLLGFYHKRMLNFVKAFSGIAKIITGTLCILTYSNG